MKKASLLSLAILSSSALFAATPIDGGDPVAPEENAKAPFNSLVKVEFDGSRCTGAVIADNVVITAGHCTKGIDASSYTLTTADGQTHKVTNVKTSYDGNLGTSGDFGVLTTDSSLGEPALEFTPKTQKQLLSSKENLYDTGFGINLTGDKTLLQSTDSNPNGDLLKGGGFINKKLFTITPEQSEEVLSYISNKYPEVQKVFNSAKANPTYEFATCSETPTDHGDSGGPVLVKEGDKFTIAGLTSWGAVLSGGSTGIQEFRACYDAKDGGKIVDNSLSINIFADMSAGSANQKQLSAYLASE